MSSLVPSTLCAIYWLPSLPGQATLGLAWQQVEWVWQIRETRWQGPGIRSNTQHANSIPYRITIASTLLTWPGGKHSPSLTIAKEKEECPKCWVTPQVGGDSEMEAEACSLCAHVFPLSVISVQPAPSSS